MLKYIQIADEETKLVNVNDNDDMTAEEATILGLSEEKHEVEQAYDGDWYLLGYAPEKQAPTHEEISSLREQAYIQEIDTLHAQRQRKTIIGTWTEENEANYIAEVKQLSEDIANRYPYPEETVTEIVEEQLELPLEV